MQLNILNLDLNLLKVFTAIYKYGRTSEAAGHLGMTQPAVSHALKRLRAHLEDELFIRTRDGMNPTQRAQEIAPIVNEALTLLQNALENAGEFDPTQSTREINISFNSICEYFLVPEILSFIEKNKSEIRINSVADGEEQAIKRLKQGQLDLVFDFIAPEDPGLESLQILEDELVVGARKGHPRIIDKVTKEDYFREQHLVMNSSPQREKQMQQFMNRQGGQRRILARLEQFAIFPYITTTCDALITTPKRMIPEESKAQLNTFPAPFETSSFPIHMIWHKSMNNDSGHRWFREQVVAAIN